MDFDLRILFLSRGDMPCHRVLSAHTVERGPGDHVTFANSFVTRDRDMLVCIVSGQNYNNNNDTTLTRMVIDRNSEGCAINARDSYRQSR